jgi:thiol-disulfide isomerase/thioredoxin
MKWLTTLTLVVAALAITGPAQAAQESSLVGQPAPEISAQFWLNSPAMTLKALRGHVVVVEFWATWCPPCRASIPHLIELSKKYTSVTFIGMTDEAKAKVEPFAKDLGMTYAVAGGSPSGGEYGVTGIPTAFIVGADGKVAWQGHPMSEGFVPAIEDQVKKTPAGPVARPRGPVTLDDVAAQLQKSQYGRAAVLLARFEAPMDDATVRTKVDRMKKTILAQMPARLALGEKSLAAKDYFKANEAFQDVVAMAPDSPQAEKAKEHLKELEGDDIKLAIGEGAQKAAADLYAEILKTEKTSKNVAPVIKAYEDLADRYPDTKGAAGAALRIKALAAKKTE